MYCSNGRFSPDMLEQFRQPAFAEAHMLGFVGDIVADELFAQVVTRFLMRFHAAVTVRKRVHFVAHRQHAVLHHGWELAAPFVDVQVLRRLEWIHAMRGASTRSP